LRPIVRQQPGGVEEDQKNPATFAGSGKLPNCGGCGKPQACGGNNASGLKGARRVGKETAHPPSAQKTSPPSKRDEGGLSAITIRVLPGALSEENGTRAAGQPTQSSPARHRATRHRQVQSSAAQL